MSCRGGGGLALPVKYLSAMRMHWRQGCYFVITMASVSERSLKHSRAAGLIVSQRSPMPRRPSEADLDVCPSGKLALQPNTL